MKKEKNKVSTPILSAPVTPTRHNGSKIRIELPCHQADPDLWFADKPADLELAKALCADCPLRLQCLAAALERGEPWGVWGGEIFDQGVIVARKRPRGRPRKSPAPDAATSAA
jgi:WhiB family redox-sensing transcriptional regulator